MPKIWQKCSDNATPSLESASQWPKKEEAECRINARKDCRSSDGAEREKLAFVPPV